MDVENLAMPERVTQLAQIALLLALGVVSQEQPYDAVTGTIPRTQRDIFELKGYCVIAYELAALQIIPRYEDALRLGRYDEAWTARMAQSLDRLGNECGGAVQLSITLEEGNVVYLIVVKEAPENEHCQQTYNSNKE